MNKGELLVPVSYSFLLTLLVCVHVLRVFTFNHVSHMHERMICVQARDGKKMNLKMRISKVIVFSSSSPFFLPGCSKSKLQQLFVTAVTSFRWSSILFGPHEGEREGRIGKRSSPHPITVQISQISRISRIDVTQKEQYVCLWVLQKRMVGWTRNEEWGWGEGEEDVS